MFRKMINYLKEKLCSSIANSKKMQSMNTKTTLKSFYFENSLLHLILSHLHFTTSEEMNCINFSGKEKTKHDAR